MSKVEELEEKIAQAKRQVLKEKYSLEDELEQLKRDKFSYQRKGDFSALEKANIREKEIKSKLNSLVTRVPSLEAQLKKAKEDEARQKTISERKRRQLEKQNTVKKQMNSILGLMRQGKTRSQAAQGAGVPLSRVAHWILEGKRGVSDYTHFYHEVTSIEEDSERRKREEINRKNRIREQERQRRLLKERQKRESERKKIEERQKRERERKKLEEKREKDIIKSQMDSIVSQMQKGKSRNQAAIYVGVSISKVNEWFDNGFKRNGEPYNSFYNKVHEIEKSESKNKQLVNKKPETPVTLKMKTCPECGKRYLNNKTECPYCKGKSTSISEVNYCQNCGKKLTNDDGDYCSKCGASLKDDKKTHKKDNAVTSSGGLPDDWGKWCIAIFIIFVIIGFILAIF